MARQPDRAQDRPNGTTEDYLWRLVRADVRVARGHAVKGLPSAQHRHRLRRVKVQASTRRQRHCELTYCQRAAGYAGGVGLGQGEHSNQGVALSSCRLLVLAHEVATASRPSSI